MTLRHWIASLAVVAVTAAPVLAQDNSNHNRRANREQSQQSQQSQQTQQTEHSRREQPQQATPQARQDNRTVPQAQQDNRAVPRTVEPQREQVQRRADVQRQQADVQRRQNVRGNDQVRRDVAVPRTYANRTDVHRWDGGHYGEPLHYRYGYYAPRIIRPTIVQVVPYRPYFYRPSWSIGVYYGSGGYYPYGYTPDYYFNPVPGRYYGGVRITGAPRDARVFADGYYVGIVDDFDGIFQHVNLEAGPHHIEIQWGEYAPIAFDVNVRPGETITFRADAGIYS